MQKRFCTCGFMVWVEYLLSSSNYNLRFFGQHGNSVSTCPCCDKSLDINSLR